MFVEDAKEVIREAKEAEELGPSGKVRQRRS
jgi:hypothetical protein